VTRSQIVTKGHGTENDFVIVADLDAQISLSPELVRALCDRHAGVGADGVLRVVRTELATEPDVRSQAGTSTYFMDYHNADGSIAEMCGNGVRVFARYLQQADLLSSEQVQNGIDVATRGGTRHLAFVGDDISVEMGAAVWSGPERPAVEVAGLSSGHTGVALQIPNPHVVVILEDVAELEALDLSLAPVVTPALPDGQNVEFVVVTGPNRIRMRVHERGVGETRSCGTGICAAVAVVQRAEASASRDPWTVEVPGGRCVVSASSTGEYVLTGPAVLVGELTLTQRWLDTHR
jgi:diaminopimelate epimerase